LFYDQGYYDDIVTERSIVASCGYPRCAAHIQPSSRPPAQYHISLTQKKVFDLTERRKFCSNFCFQASNFYRQQLETAPLWLREQSTAV
jgi:RNA polymerase II-associated protein 2